LLYFSFVSCGSFSNLLSYNSLIAPFLKCLRFSPSQGHRSVFCAAFEAPVPFSRPLFALVFYMTFIFLVGLLLFVLWPVHTPSGRCCCTFFPLSALPPCATCFTFFFDPLFFPLSSPYASVPFHGEIVTSCDGCDLRAPFERGLSREAPVKDSGTPSAVWGRRPFLLRGTPLFFPFLILF